MADNHMLAALRRKSVAYRSAGMDALADRADARIAQLEAKAAPVAEPPAEEPEEPDREDGVYGVGGGWHEVDVGGEVVDKVRGADAAQEAFDAYSED